MSSFKATHYFILYVFSAVVCSFEFFEQIITKKFIILESFKSSIGNAITDLALFTVANKMTTSTKMQ